MGKSCNKLVCIASLAVVVSLAAQSTSTAQRTNWTAEQLSNPFPAAASEQELIESLRTGEPAEKAIACKQLAIYGSKSAVPELAKLLANEELGLVVADRAGSNSRSGGGCSARRGGEDAARPAAGGHDQFDWSSAIGRRRRSACRAAQGFGCSSGIGRGRGAGSHRKRRRNQNTPPIARWWCSCGAFRHC